MLPAHLESNFINPEWNGAQPTCTACAPQAAEAESAARATSRGDEILAGDRARIAPSVGIVTLAPELPGGLDLVRDLVTAGHRVSIGHTGATYEEARGGDRRRRTSCDASVQSHVADDVASPGVVGAVLESDAVAAEIICDGVSCASRRWCRPGDSREVGPRA